MKFALFLFAAFSVATSDDPCPFSPNNECRCVTDSSGSFSFSSVDCTSHGLPSFTGEQGLYKVTGRLSIRGDVSNIPSDHFMAFIGINELYLEQTVGAPPVYQKWNAQSFRGPFWLYNLTVVGLAGLFPAQPSNWTAHLTGQLTGRLSISKSPALSFADNDFSSIFLETLEVIDSSIKSISPNAFSSFFMLNHLTLNNAGLTSFVIESSTIRNLNLDQNGKLDRVSLDQLPVAETVSLNGNDLTAAVTDDSFTFHSTTLVDVFMESCSLTAIPPRIFGQYFKPNGTLSLAKNAIASLKDTDFQYCDQLNKVDLTDAIRMDTVDLGVFANIGSGVKDSVSIVLDNNSAMKKVVASRRTVS